MIKKKDMGYICGRMATGIKENDLMEDSMEKVPFLSVSGACR